eukprot:scaffold573_cov46-Phaeocystis_antarctica.AAC.2
MARGGLGGSAARAADRPRPAVARGSLGHALPQACSAAERGLRGASWPRPESDQVSSQARARGGAPEPSGVRHAGRRPSGAEPRGVASGGASVGGATERGRWAAPPPPAAP